MNAKTDFEKLSVIIPHRYHVDAIELLRPYLSPEMLSETDEYMANFKLVPIAPKEVINAVFRLVGELTGITNVQHTNKRLHPEVTARQLAMYALYYEIPNFSLASVGHAFTHKFNHATVINAHKSIEAFYATNLEFRKLINQLADNLSEMNLSNLKARLTILKTI